MTHVVVARWRCAPGNAATVTEILRDLAAQSRREPGVVRFVVHRAAEEPGSFLIYEEYADEAAFRAHRATAHFRDLVLGRAVPLLDARTVEAFAAID
ncbi:putative quinol monooxygenase [Propylenella binzhouense]|uniref:Antibiotic biosynthesis monooxygenase n=1 Tax=Propylenella binzhouense TaxID=2555902 RepID=A0A964WS05_9HYPH|nr:putative quinol monooxygenase [Propylenella binzhouense]MYZ46340.1 antibiotic biosynthesis monooxygenase [Propylenella binzhouense]